VLLSRKHPTQASSSHRRVLVGAQSLGDLPQDLPTQSPTESAPTKECSLWLGHCLPFSIKNTAELLNGPTMRSMVGLKWKHSIPKRLKSAVVNNDASYIQIQGRNPALMNDERQICKAKQ
jgi:hypothetical protein